MPHGPGSVGNLASEDIVYLLNEMGVETGIDIEEAIAAAREIVDMLVVTPGEPRRPYRFESGADGAGKGSAARVSKSLEPPSMESRRNQQPA